MTPRFAVAPYISILLSNQGWPKEWGRVIRKIREDTAVVFFAAVILRTWLTDVDQEKRIADFAPALP
jgi:hypothetical protein